jgi:lysophospholipase L1-like esterase
MRYLALGDSYTIGEMVDSHVAFPNQVVAILNAKKSDIHLENIIAKTGWTTDELALEISKQTPTHNYDWVTLLIGVNNQYRGRSLEEYEWQFYSLLCQAILFANGNAKRVIVLSIPDWGMTPFNSERDKTETSKQIDAFNKINRSITLKLQCNYIDITESTREHAQDEAYLAIDLLHYSEKEYAIWAQKVASIICP